MTVSAEIASEIRDEINVFQHGADIAELRLTFEEKCTEGSDRFKDVLAYGDNKDRVQDENCVFIPYVYLTIEKMRKTILTRMINLIAATELRVLAGGYLKIQEERDNRVNKWIQDVFRNEDFVCAAFHFDRSLWKSDVYIKEVLDYLRMVNKDFEGEIEEMQCNVPDDWVHFKNKPNLKKDTKEEPYKETFWGKTFWIDFYLWPKAKNSDEWTNVFRFTNSKDEDTKDGARCPALFVGSSTMSVANSVNGNGNYKKSIDYNYKTDKVIHLALSQQSDLDGKLIYSIVQNGKTILSIENKTPVKEMLNPKLYLSDNEYITWGTYGELTEFRFMRHKISKSFWVNGIEFYLEMAAARKGEAEKVCKDKNMMIMEPKNSRIASGVDKVAKQAGLKRYWINIKRENKSVSDDPSQYFYYESNENDVAWDDWAWMEPKSSQNSNCAMVGYFGSGDKWASASCDAPGDIICQELPKLE